ncbi:hypothetical protein ABE527_02370 [Brucella sp. TWI432]
MFGMLTNLTKAAVAATVQTPVAMLADAVTMGGALTGKDVPYTVDALGAVVKNIEQATDPKKD